MGINTRHVLSGGLVVLSLVLVGGVIYGSVERRLTDGDLFQDNLIDTVGEIRDHRLDQITAEYIQENPQGQFLFVDGRRLAPLPYINSELRDLEATWRVKMLDGELEFSEVT